MIQSKRRKKNLWLRSPITVVLLVVFAAVGYLAFFPMQAEASGRSADTFKPVYFNQLEKYSFEVELHRKEEERRSREEALEKAVVRHIVMRGETLSRIAALYETDISSLISWNRLSNPNLIHPGQALDILTIKGALYKVRNGDTLEAIARVYQVEPQLISSFNLLEESSQLTSGKNLVIPGGVVPQPVRRTVQPTLLASRGDGEYPQPPVMQWPLKGKITSLFGWRGSSFHYGLDIAAPRGRQVNAAASGVVDYAAYKGGYGLVLIINHGSGWSTLYAHNSSLLAQVGQNVASGQPISLVGATGDATGDHLHLEIIYYNRRLDPLPYLP
ncbi:MAG: M23 family metallopeptidase [Bacillota bacterium]|nr:M23 family metallopeptidase [Bacillota bacterium]